MVRITRRRLLQVSTGVFDTAFAGCTGGDTTTDTPTPSPTEHRVTPATPTPKAMTPFDATKVDAISSVGPIERKVHKLISDARAKRGENRLRWDPRLSYIGRLHARDMAKRDYFAHKNPEGQTAKERAKEYGIQKYNGIVGNIAKMPRRSRGPKEIGRELFLMWKNSKPHWKVILAEANTHHGCGVYITKSNGVYASSLLAVNAEVSEEI